MLNLVRSCSRGRRRTRRAPNGLLAALALACGGLLAWVGPAAAEATLFEMQGRLLVETQPDGSMSVSLLAGGALGLGGVAAGRVTVTTTEEALWLSGESEVSGVEPTPFFPVGEGDYSGVEPTPFAPDDVRVLTFTFDSAGDYSGVEPTPFHVFLFTPSGLVGELLFDTATAEVGSLILSGVVLDETGHTSEIATFTIEALPEPVPVLPGAGVLGLGAGLGASGWLGLRLRRR